MSRPLRIEYPGAFYHIMSRGNEKSRIFKDNNDYNNFLEKLEENTVRYNIKVHTYCLMINHYHLILETLEGNLTKAMQCLNSSYTSYFNIKHKRVGHLFQGRYKSILVQAEEYLNHLSRYIHLNPVKAKLVKHPGEYPWSSYRYFISEETGKSFVKKDCVLKMFSDNELEAISRYRGFVEGDMGEEKAIIRENIVGGAILGDEKFVKWVKEESLKGRKDKGIPQLKQIRKSFKVNIEEIQNVVKQSVMRNKKSKKIEMYLIRKYIGKKLGEIAGNYGKISCARISQVYQEIKEERVRNKKLDELIMKIEKRLKLKV